MSSIDWRRVAFMVAAVVIVSVAAPVLLYVGGVAWLALTGRPFE